MVNANTSARHGADDTGVYAGGYFLFHTGYQKQIGGLLKHVIHAQFLKMHELLLAGSEPADRCQNRRRRQKSGPDET
jgi:hypothetical protein